jgi:hypothetical protein
MPLKLYMDQHVPRAITMALRERGLDVLTAYEDGSDRLADDFLLDRATTLVRVLFTEDDDLLAEAHKRQQSGQTFAGVIYAHQLRVSVGRCIEDLELLCVACVDEELADQVTFLPV